MSLTADLAAYFQARPSEWIDAHVLLKIAGFAAWRSRLSDLRRAPFHFNIENRQRREKRIAWDVEMDCAGQPVRMRGGVRACVVTEYRYVPQPTATVADMHDANRPFTLL